MAYRPAPLDPLVLLAELRSVDVPIAHDRDGLTPAEVAAIAVQRHPDLVAARVAFGVAKAQLVEAGLLPDPEVSFDAGDVIASEATGGVAGTEQVLSGLGLSWPVPRPGEIGARTGVAAARVDEARLHLLDAEWQVAQRAELAFVDVIAARARLALDDEVLALLQRNVDVLQRGQQAGGATAIDVGLAQAELAALQQTRLQQAGERTRAQQQLANALGLPPEAELPLASEGILAADDRADVDVAAAVEAAVRQRPDLRARLAAYEASEQSLRLAIAEQWPEIAIGTGIAVVLPVLSRLNRPAIETALAERTRAAAEVRASVHVLRAEVHEAVAAWRAARAEVEGYRRDLQPKIAALSESLQRAFDLRAVSAVELIVAQRQGMELRRQGLEAQVRLARARVRLRMVTGAIAGANEDRP